MGTYFHAYGESVAVSRVVFTRAWSSIDSRHSSAFRIVLSMSNRGACLSDSTSENILGSILVRLESSETPPCDSTKVRSPFRKKRQITVNKVFLQCQLEIVNCCLLVFSKVFNKVFVPVPHFSHRSVSVYSLKYDLASSISGACGASSPPQSRRTSEK